MELTAILFSWCQQSVLLIAKLGGAATVFAGKTNLLGKMTARKKIAVMLGVCSLAAAVVLAGVILLPKQDKAADQSSWVLLSGENHLIVNEGKPLIFTALQESDRRKIRSGALDSERNAGEGRVVRRPADFSELKFYEVSSDNSLKPVNPSRFSITIKDDGIQHTLQLASFKVNGKTVLSPADPDFMETSYTASALPANTSRIPPVFYAAHILKHKASSNHD